MKYIIKGIVYILFIGVSIIRLIAHWLLLVIWTFRLNPYVRVIDKWGHFVAKMKFSTHIKYRMKQIKNQLAL